MNKQVKAIENKKTFMKRRAESLNLVDENALVQRLGSVIDAALKSNEIKDHVDLNVAADVKYGDFSSTLPLRLAKSLHKNPKDIANDLAEKLKESPELSEIFAEISAAPNGFINFKLSEKFLLSELVSASKQGENFGHSDVGNARKFLIESPSINPNAPTHVGHLLNLFIGRALARLFQEVGFEVELDNLINDRGIKLCQVMWAIKNFAKDATPESEKIKPDHFVGKYYVLGIKAYKEDLEAKKEMDDLLRKWESCDPETISLWKKVVNWSYSGAAMTFERLHEEEGYKWYESDIYEGGKEIITENVGKGVVEKLDDGATVAKLSKKYGIPDAVLLRSDGTSIYMTQDIYLAYLKVEKFKPWKVIWIVGNEQIQHFHQLFAVLDSLKILPLASLYHFAYGLVVDKNGKKISSRTGQDITADEMLDVMHAGALKVIEDRKINVDLQNKDEVAEAVGQGALRYAFLSHDPYRDIKFDKDEALSFTGKSGPYVMYAHSRGKSVLRKAEQKDASSFDEAQLINADLSDVDRVLILKLLQFPEVTISAANNYAPNVLAGYLYDIASSFNNLYEKENISGAEGATRVLRLCVTALVTDVLKKGLEILGIEAPDRM